MTAKNASSAFRAQANPSGFSFGSTAPAFGDQSISQSEFSFGSTATTFGAQANPPSGFSFGSTASAFGAQVNPPFRFSFGSKAPTFGAHINAPSTGFSEYSFGATGISTPLANLFGETARTEFKFSAPSSTAFEAQENASSTDFSGFSFGATGTSTPLANLFGETATTGKTEFKFCVPSSTTWAFSFGTETAISTTAELRFGTGITTTTAARFETTTTTTTSVGLGSDNATTINTKAGFGFRPLQSKNDFLFGTSTSTGTGSVFCQSTTNASSSFTFSTPAYYTIAPLKLNLSSTGSTTTASPGFALRDEQGSNTLRGFGGAIKNRAAPSCFKSLSPRTSSVVAAPTEFVSTTEVEPFKICLTASYIPDGLAFANVASRISSASQQPSGFHFDVPNSNATVHSTFSTLTFNLPQTTVNTPNPFQFPSATALAAMNDRLKGTSSAQSGIGDGFNKASQTGTSIKFNAPKIDMKWTVAGNHIRYQCIVCMKEYQNKSLEELRLEDYDGLVFKKSAPNFSFFNPTQFSLGSTEMLNSNNIFGSVGGLFGQTQQNQTPVGSGISSTSMASPFSFHSTFNASVFDQNEQHRKAGEAHFNVKQEKISTSIALPVAKTKEAKKTQKHVKQENAIPKDLLLSDLTKEAKETNGDVKQEDAIPKDLLLADLTKPVMQSLSEQLPLDTSSEGIHIHVRLPKGEILSLSYIAETPLSLLLTYIASQGYPVTEYKVLAIWSRQDLTVLNKNKTLEDLKLFSEELLIVKKR